MAIGAVDAPGSLRADDLATLKSKKVYIINTGKNLMARFMNPFLNDMFLSLSILVKQATIKNGMAQIKDPKHIMTNSSGSFAKSIKKAGA